MAAQQGRPFAVFDIDGTLIRWQLYHAITDALGSRGHIQTETYQAMRDARMSWKRRSGGSFKDYERQVIGTYDAIIKTLTFTQLDEAIDAVFEEYKDQVFTYTRDLIAKLKAENYLLFAISGSQTEILAKIAEYYGFNDYIGSIYKRSKSTFTGDKFVGSRQKDISLKKLVAKHNAKWENSYAVGDSLSDVLMLELVKNPIAFNPDKELFDHAKSKGWKIVLERKNMIYELEPKGGRYELAKAG